MTHSSLFPLRSTFFKSVVTEELISSGFYLMVVKNRIGSNDEVE